MAIRFACPACETAYTVNDRDAGKKADCKKCGQRLQVPSPPRLKTVLGEVLPDALSTRPPAGHARPAMGRLEPAGPGALPASPVPGPGGGPIRFACPGCGTDYVVNRASAGRSMDCRSCGQTMTVPGGATHEDRPPLVESVALPVASFAETAERGPPPEPEPEGERDVNYPSPRRPPNRPVNRVVAGVGAGLLFIGLFLPMIHGPAGFWMSFIDFPWKAVTVGFAVADVIAKAEPRREREPMNPPVRQDNDQGQTAKEEEGAVLAVLVGVGSVLYPVFILAVLMVTGLQIATGRTATAYLFAGIGCAGATVLYGFAVLMLNAIPVLRVVMAVLSPGFGWAVLFVGSFMLMVAGVMRPLRRE